MNRDRDQLRFPGVRKIVRSREQRRVDPGAMSWPEPARLLLRELNDGWKLRDARNGAADDARFQFRKPLDV